MDNDIIVGDNFDPNKVFFDPDKVSRDSITQTTQIKRKSRLGQQAFRMNVMAAYKFHCCITDCDLVEAMEANHIVPYKNPDHHRSRCLRRRHLSPTHIQ